MVEMKEVTEEVFRARISRSNAGPHCGRDNIHWAIHPYTLVAKSEPGYGAPDSPKRYWVAEDD